MTENDAGLADYLPGMEPPAASSIVSAAYAKAIERLRSDGVIGDEHAGICASIMTLAEIADNPTTKAYARNGALQEAHEQMRTLLDAAKRQGDADYATFETWLAAQQ
ncbi:hypothetical protein FVO59_12820 [Microbacterium esteraromaticum]|uniref:Uncharacterized protein n=1 Tax=Microbacterium esteraromaticum TaxID=57043 RepID=A0A7D8AKT8_9MICO|nr:hypothetical protein [Microbacterium esteraromaticum]QMU97986.1 hypothetical protein FVO59_12820 [Microbacterium esteraromaticum]